MPPPALTALYDIQITALISMSFFYTVTWTRREQVLVLIIINLSAIHRYCDLLFSFLYSEMTPNDSSILQL